jgi:predicted pyridoxine 5'-phosphate oxidase superfamily flavin-nucleotide-binding protein
MDGIEFSQEMRELQDRFGTRRLADKVAEHVFHAKLSDKDVALVEAAMFFFMATVDGSGRPQCSYKGGPKGFVKVTGPSELVFPFYEGNGLYLSAGNIVQTGNVGLLFVDFENQRRIRINGTAQITRAHPALDGVAAAQLVCMVSVTDVHPNCSRNVHKMQVVEQSRHTPKAPDQDVAKADWGAQFQDVLPDHMKPA